MNSRCYLIGYRGTGKSTIGPLLAQSLGWSFMDADSVLENRYGNSIRQIFASEGEPAFRDKESLILQELAGYSKCVIATGGGIILRETNRQCLRRSGFIIWLSADPTTILRRIAADPTTQHRRPQLTTGGLGEIETLLQLRIPFYQELADLKIDTSERSPTSLVEDILTQWKPYHPM